MPGFRALRIPSSPATVDLTVFRISHLPTFVLPAAAFIQPILPGHENLNGTTYSYLISNSKKNKKILFDLGPRKDLENLAPAVRAFLNGFNFNAPKDITELLHDAETPLDAINAVIFSHVHFDHIGDMSLFPYSTELVIGPGTVRDLYDPVSNPNGTLLATDFANRTVTELDFSKSKTEIGGRLSCIGLLQRRFSLHSRCSWSHAGHIAALLRVKPTSFVLLSGDTFHHVGQVRPTAALHKAVPISEELLSSAHSHISRDYFRSGGNDTEGFDFQARSGPFFQIPELGFYSDPATARTSQLGIEAFDANDDIFVVASHDSTIYPLTSEDKTTAFNDWKVLGFKKQVTWQFVNTICGPQTVLDNHLILSSIPPPPSFDGAMVTPQEGTIQHQDLEALQLPPHSKPVKSWLTTYSLKLISPSRNEGGSTTRTTALILACIAGVCAYNISTCALGRFFLDHFHLWTRTMSPDAPTVEKHAELIVALLAGCVSVPLTILTFAIVDDLDRELWIQGWRFQIMNIHNIIIWIFVVVLISVLPTIAAMIHLKFHHVTPVSTLAVFGFGSLITLPLSIALIACFVWFWFS
ncbi:hypothetical protein DL96DRAFT_1701725 [Flagelloscypha sp. PMI_526]|nr:hypothetical protein DL96DRAFT_1701725 [Flagelloscypha sp. PMI_526]